MRAKEVNLEREICWNLQTSVAHAAKARAHKQVHPDLHVLDEHGRRNPERETALYLRSLCRDEDKPDDFVTVRFAVPDGQESNPLIHHPRVNIKRRRKRVAELPSSDEW